MDRETERLARIWYLSRAKAGVSQEKLSFELGVSRKTIQNWEKGVSTPSLDQAFRWFEVLHESPLPYVFQYVFPSMENISPKDEDEHLRESLIQMIEQLPMEGVRQLLYLFYGDHGSSPRAILNLMTAHLQTPMRDRINHGIQVEKNYEIAKKKGMLTSSEHIQPDVELLKNAIQKGEEAFLKDKSAYVMKEENS